MSTPAYKKAQRQAAQAEAKRKREFEKKYGSRKCTKKQEFKEYVPSQSYVRTTKEYPSLSPSDTIPGSCSKREPSVYTGDLICGIATMHKSNAVPVMRGTSQAEDIAKMRRN